MKDAVATMGTILPVDVGGRDAVHVAVISAIAGETLHPGQHVGLNDASTDDSDRVAATMTKHIGIVDPFLECVVYPQQRFWLYLYPRTITGLRHLWTHPDFDHVGDTYDTPAHKLAAEKWLRDFAERADLSYKTVMQSAAEFVRSGEYYVQYDYETARDEMYTKGTQEEFWKNYEIVTGEHVPEEKRGSVFSCSC